MRSHGRQLGLTERMWHGENHDLLQPYEQPMENMQASHMNSFPRLNQISYTSQGLKNSKNKRDSTYHKLT